MQRMGRPKHALKVPCFFSCYVWGGGGTGGGERFFFIFPGFPMCSHYVPFKFPMGSQYFPQHFLHTSSLLSHMPWKMVSSFHLYCIGGPKGRNCTVQNRAFCFGESPLFLFFGVMSQSNWHVAEKKRKYRTWEAPDLINRRGDYFPKLISLPLA